MSEYYREIDLIKRYKISRRTLYRLIKGGFPKPFKIGNSNRWAGEELDAWERKQKESR